MQYSMHIYREIRWRLNFTPNVAATRKRIDDLRASLDQPDKQAQATKQQADDGLGHGHRPQCVVSAPLLHG